MELSYNYDYDEEASYTEVKVKELGGSKGLFGFSICIVAVDSSTVTIFYLLFVISLELMGRQRMIDCIGS